MAARIRATSDIPGGMAVEIPGPAKTTPWKSKRRFVKVSAPEACRPLALLRYGITAQRGAATTMPGATGVDNYLTAPTRRQSNLSASLRGALRATLTPPRRRGDAAITPAQLGPGT